MKTKMQSGTVLVCMELDNRLYFAADKRISWGWGKAATTPTNKVVKRNGILMSGTGSASLIFEVIHRSKIPVYKEGQDVEKFVYNKLLPAIIGDLRHKNYVDSKERRLVSRNNKDTDEMHAVILVGLRNKKKCYVFELDLTCDMITIDRVPTDYAHGCGGFHAQAVVTFVKGYDFFADKIPTETKDGSLYTCNQIYKVLQMSPEDILESAIMVAAQHSPGCDANCDIEVL